METMLTREQMEATIRRGGSIKHGGSIITSIHELPDPSALAGNDTNKIRREMETVMDRMAKDEGYLRQLERQLENAEKFAADETRRREAAQQAKPQPPIPPQPSGPPGVETATGGGEQMSHTPEQANPGYDPRR